MEETKKEVKPEMLHPFNAKKGTGIFSPAFLVSVIVVIAMGIGIGYMTSTKRTSMSSNGSSTQISGSTITKGTVVGSEDTKTFKDQAEGVLEDGGIDGEGQYHLVRPGGDSQNVYLTSSIVDLSSFVKKKIRVWGQTNAAQKAGWLMDVGRVEVLE